MNLQEIQAFWVDAGKSFPTKSAVTPTSRDPYLGQLERQNIARHLTEVMDVLEVGCGDAGHTVEYARHCRSIHGHDISPGLLAVAR